MTAVVALIDTLEVVEVSIESALGVVIEGSIDIIEVSPTETVTILEEGAQGVKGEAGTSSSLDWAHYINNTKYGGITVAIGTGDVLTYVYEPTTTTVYRYITTATTGLYPTEDAFYSNFDGTDLDNLIVGR
jgi:hypothetical protein